MKDIELNLDQVLPKDGFAGTLIGRAWVPGAVPGPSVVVVRDGGVDDISDVASTVSELLESADPVSRVHQSKGKRLGTVADLIQNSGSKRDQNKPFLIAPCDLQPIKAAGVTFAVSLIERVIEERSDGDPTLADSVRKQLESSIGDKLRNLKPGSPQAAKVKEVLIEQGLWSQYLEVGIGPDAEIFTKGPVLSAVGIGSDVGIHSMSAWNNPEPEVVLAVNSRGQVVGATLGNDVNLRDIEGRSALLLGKAKDNNASCGLGPFIRLFDATFSIDDVRNATVDLLIEGPEGFTLRGMSSMTQISRDPLDLVSQAIGRHHQYPDGVMLFMGTMFAPTEDRDQPGNGFTHKLGDIVRISSPKLGTLVNRVNHSDKAPPWVFGIRALFANLAARGLLPKQ
jgi:fumarylacetoacetate (FAA) hydrolase family protein